MKTLLWIILTLVIIFVALLIGTGLMTGAEVFQAAINGVNTASELTASVIK